MKDNFELPIRDFSFLDDESLSIEEKCEKFNDARKMVFKDMAIFSESIIKGLSNERIIYWFPGIFKGNLFTIKDKPQ